jgi:D-proline reductase (dithiol) PrdB
MGELSEFSLSTRLFLKAYPWRRIENVPWTVLSKPLAECRLGLISTAGFVGPGDAPFDNAVRGGDPSFREIPGDIDVSKLREHHRSESFDHQGLAEDPNLAFPIDRLRELVARGRLGGLNRRHLSFMGSITAPGRLLRDSLPEAARLFEEDEVDVALLVPV